MTFSHPYALLLGVALLFVADLAPGLSSSGVATLGNHKLGNNATNDRPRTRSVDDGKHEERAGIDVEFVGALLERLKINADVIKAGGRLAYLFKQEPESVHRPSDDLLMYLRNWRDAGESQHQEFSGEVLKQMRQKALASHISRLDIASVVEGLSLEYSTKVLQDVVTMLGNKWGKTEVAIAIELAKPESFYNALSLENAQFNQWLDLSEGEFWHVERVLMEEAQSNEAIGDVVIVNKIMKEYLAHCKMLASSSK